MIKRGTLAAACLLFLFVCMNAKADDFSEGIIPDYRKGPPIFKVKLVDLDLSGVDQVEWTHWMVQTIKESNVFTNKAGDQRASIKINFSWDTKKTGGYDELIVGKTEFSVISENGKTLANWTIPSTGAVVSFAANKRLVVNRVFVRGVYKLFIALRNKYQNANLNIAAVDKLTEDDIGLIGNLAKVVYAPFDLAGSTIALLHDSGAMAATANTITQVEQTRIQGDAKVAQLNNMAAAESRRIQEENDRLRREDEARKEAMLAEEKRQHEQMVANARAYNAQRQASANQAHVQPSQQGDAAAHESGGNAKPRVHFAQQGVAYGSYEDQQRAQAAGRGSPVQQVASASRPGSQISSLPQRHTSSTNSNPAVNRKEEMQPVHDESIDICWGGTSTTNDSGKWYKCSTPCGGGIVASGSLEEEKTKETARLTSTINIYDEIDKKNYEATVYYYGHAIDIPGGLCGDDPAKKMHVGSLPLRKKYQCPKNQINTCRTEYNGT